MSMPKLYIVISARSIAELEDKMSALLKEKKDFMTAGGITMTTDNYGSIYLQAVYHHYRKKKRTLEQKATTAKYQKGRYERLREEKREREAKEIVENE